MIDQLTSFSQSFEHRWPALRVRDSASLAPFLAAARPGTVLSMAVAGSPAHPAPRSGSSRRSTC